MGSHSHFPRDFACYIYFLITFSFHINAQLEWSSKKFVENLALVAMDIRSLLLVFKPLKKKYEYQGKFQPYNFYGLN